MSKLVKTCLKLFFWFSGLENAYAELVSLAVERRSRLEESRQLWQFYWDMAEEQNWIKEMGHIVSQAEIGHDLTTIHLLLSKHKSLETEIRYSFFDLFISGNQVSETDFRNISHIFKAILLECHDLYKNTNCFKCSIWSFYCLDYLSDRFVQVHL